MFNKTKMKIEHLEEENVSLNRSIRYLSTLYERQNKEMTALLDYYNLEVKQIPGHIICDKKGKQEA